MEETLAEIEVDKPPACFLDTNVLVYAASLSAPLHQRAAEEIRRRHESKRPATREWIRITPLEVS